MGRQTICYAISASLFFVGIVLYYTGNAAAAGHVLPIGFAGALFLSIGHVPPGP